MEVISSFVLGLSLGVLGTHFAYLIYFHLYLTTKIDALLDKAEKVPKSLAHSGRWLGLASDIFTYATSIAQCATRFEVKNEGDGQNVPSSISSNNGNSHCNTPRRRMAPPERVDRYMDTE